MTIELTPEQSKAIEAPVQAGTYRDEGQVIDEAIRLLKERVELQARVDAGVRQLDEGQFRTYQPNERDRFIKDVEAASRAVHIASRKDSA